LKIKLYAYKCVNFPHTDFFGSKIGSTLSYVWQSIFSSKDVVKQGARWCIGTNTRILLMGHPLLITSDRISPTQTGNTYFCSIYVSEVIDLTSKIRKTYLVSPIFDQHTTNLILNTPLSPQLTIDTLMWKGEKSSRFLLEVRMMYVQSPFEI